MVTSLIRTLLRDWKRMQHFASIADDSGDSSCNRIYLKPQENNLHIWHVVLYDDEREYEIYCVCYFQEPEDSEARMIMKCCTPNSYMPVNRHICLSYLTPLLYGSGGLLAFYEELRLMFFSHNNKLIHKESGLLMKTWNRVICKEFQWNFQNLHDEYLPISDEGMHELNSYIATERLNVLQKRERRLKVTHNYNENYFPLKSKVSERGILACDNSSKQEDVPVLPTLQSHQHHLRATKRQRQSNGVPAVTRMHDPEEENYKRKRR